MSKLSLDERLSLIDERYSSEFLSTKLPLGLAPQDLVTTYVSYLFVVDILFDVEQSFDLYSFNCFDSEPELRSYLIDKISNSCLLLRVDARIDLLINCSTASLYRILLNVL